MNEIQTADLNKAIELLKEAVGLVDTDFTRSVETNINSTIENCSNIVGTYGFVTVEVAADPVDDVGDGIG